MPSPPIAREYFCASSLLFTLHPLPISFGFPHDQYKRKARAVARVCAWRARVFHVMPAAPPAGGRGDGSREITCHLHHDLRSQLPHPSPTSPAGGRGDGSREITSKLHHDLRSRLPHPGRDVKPDFTSRPAGSAKTRSSADKRCSPIPSVHWPASPASSCCRARAPEAQPAFPS